MNVLKALRQIVAPELNFLYTVPPASRPDGGFEPGWSSREHALHTFFVARLLGATAELRSGDFAVLSRTVPPLTSLGTPERHAWCAVQDTVPVDLGMTFALFPQAPQLKAPVAGEGENGGWQIRYARDETVLDENLQAEHEIIFIERAVLDHTPAALLDDPFRFLPAPKIGERGRWHAFFGPDFYAKVSLHCFRCVQDETASVQKRFTRAQAASWIATNYPAPEARIREALGAAS
jgi:hypothetical protein